MLPWGKIQANCGHAVLLTAALLVVSACASTGPAGPTLSEPKASATKRAQSEKSQGAPAKTPATKAAIDAAQIRALAKQAAPNNPDEQERLFRDFMEWSKERQKR
jgi:hypothetical protein